MTEADDGIRDSLYHHRHRSTVLSNIVIAQVDVTSAPSHDNMAGLMRVDMRLPSVTIDTRRLETKLKSAVHLLVVRNHIHSDHAVRVDAHESS